MTVETSITEPDVQSPELVDRQWFALAWYGQTLQRICSDAELSLLEIGHLPAHLAPLPGADSGHLVACSDDLLAPGTDLTARVVVGGPCMGDCTRFPTLEALYDCVQPMLTARALGTEALLYIGDREEAMGAGGKGRWGKLGERFARWLPALAEAVGLTRLTVVLTSSSTHEEALRTCGNAAAALDRAALDRAFHVGSGSITQWSDEGHEVTRRVVEAHLPKVVSHHVGRSADVLIGENLQQAGVFSLANRVVGQNGKISLLAHFPAPSPSASQRMYRAEAWDKIPAWELERIVSGSPPALHRYTEQFFATWLDPELRKRIAAAARAW